MNNKKAFKSLIILVLLLSLGTNIYLCVKYYYLKKYIGQMERYAKNSYCSEFRLISNSSYKVLSEDKLSDSLVKVDKASAYVYPIAAISRSTIADSIEEITFELKKQIDMLLSVVRKHGVENEFAIKLHRTVINELEEVVDIIEKDTVGLEKLKSTTSQIIQNTRSYYMEYYSEFPDN